jgi:endoglucanase
MLDAHFDEVGMIVSGITDEGLLRIQPIGGIDCKILPASDVWIYTRDGKRYGVITAVSPHLAGGRDTNPNWENLLIDIGCTKEEAQQVVEIGTPVGFYNEGETLLGNRITGHSLDDKACCAGLLCAVDRIPAEELEYDIYVTLSAGEEVGSRGAGCAAWTIQPDFAVITDVNFATTPGANAEESGKLGAGPIVSRSVITDRKFTKRILDLAKENEIPVSVVVEPTNTGTNANSLVFSREGVRCAVLSLPIGGMHSYNELLDLADAEYFIRLVKLIITRGV